MIAAWWHRLGRIWGWQRAEKPRPKARRLAKGWWRHPAPFDKGWRKDVVARPF